MGRAEAAAAAMAGARPKPCRHRQSGDAGAADSATWGGPNRGAGGSPSCPPAAAARPMRVGEMRATPSMRKPLDGERAAHEHQVPGWRSAGHAGQATAALPSRHRPARRHPPSGRPPAAADDGPGGAGEAAPAPPLARPALAIQSMRGHGSSAARRDLRPGSGSSSTTTTTRHHHLRRVQTERTASSPTRAGSTRCSESALAASGDGGATHASDHHPRRSNASRRRRRGLGVARARGNLR